MKLILLSLITNKNNSFKSMNEISDSVVNNSEKSLLKLLLHFYEIIKKKIKVVYKTKIIGVYYNLKISCLIQCCLVCFFFVGEIY